MPTLSELSGMDIALVNMWISKVSHSSFYQVHPKEIVEQLRYSEARRYLTKLIIMNEKYKSNLSSVSE